MATPGATTSGERVSEPPLEKGAMPSSAKAGVGPESAAPTATTKGSQAGESRPSAVGPPLPPAATTTRPSCQARSTAKASGSSR